MPSNLLLKKYARLAVKVGANVAKNQVVVINAPAECADFVRLVVAEAYKAKAKEVFVEFTDAHCRKMKYLNEKVEILKEFRPYQEAKMRHFLDNDVAKIHIVTENPGLMKDVDAGKIQAVNVAYYAQPIVKESRRRSMANESQWTIVAVPNPEWAKKVFPELSTKRAVEALWEKILMACRVDRQSDPIANWQEHMDTLARHNQILNNYQFKELHFQNSRGTDLRLGMVDNHIWAGGREADQKGRVFAPNIPTEETFSMPHKYHVNGKVVATLPLNYQGKLIENFHLVFKDGKVVSYHAEKEEAALKNLLELDEGSSRLGEVALISHNSPISNTGILFYETLFDENASCHLALGDSYPMNIKGGISLNEKEKDAAGSNDSNAHVDFMFGSSDMKITGITKDGKKVAVFENGNFVF